jgi:hypothetical protein
VGFRIGSYLKRVFLIFVLVFMKKLLGFLWFLALPVAAQEAPIDAATPIFSVPALEGLNSLQPPATLRGTLASVSNGILALRPLPEASMNHSGGTSRGVFLPVNPSIRAVQWFPDGQNLLLHAPNAPSGPVLWKLNIESQTLRALPIAAADANAEAKISRDGQFLALLGKSAGSPPTFTLSVFDLKLKTGRGLGTDAPLSPKHFNWGAGSRLFYSLQKAGQKYPEIRVFEAGKNVDAEFLPRAWRPLPSPDGSQIGFFGVEEDGLLSRRWGENPRGAKLSVAKSDGSGRRALWAQDGAYPQWQWRGENAIFTIKNKDWIPDLGDHQIRNFQPLRAADYKGGLAGELDVAGESWSYLALLRHDIPERQIYQISPSSTVEYDFEIQTGSRDGGSDFWTQIQRGVAAGDEKPLPTKTGFWMRRGERDWTRIATWNNEAAVAFFDESRDDAPKTPIRDLLAPSKTLGRVAVPTLEQD